MSPTTPAASGSTDEHASRNYTAEIAICWTVVAIPLAYGVYNTIKNTLPLFGE